jgi:hypothetical protein
MRLVSWIIALMFLAASVYVGFSDSWGRALLFFLLFAGVELLVVVLTPLRRRTPNCGRDPGN